MQQLDTPQLINESYKIWKKNVPSLYNILQTYQLQSCSQSIQWLRQSYIDNSWKCMSLLIGTNSLSNNAVYQLNVYVPTDEAIVDCGEYSQTKSQLQVGSAGYVGTMGVQNVDIKTTWHQDSQVMRIKLSRTNTTTTPDNLMAIKTGGSNPQLSIYNLTLTTQHQQQQQKLTLHGHQAQGYGLAWNNMEQSILASCSYDKKLLVYNIAQDNSTPIREYQTGQYLQDVKWMHGNKDILCTVSQNKTISLYDIRDTSNKPSITKSGAHNGQIYALDFNKYAQNLLLTGCEDGDVYLWDVRNMSKKFNSFVGHSDAITALQWSLTNPTQFVSSSSDRKVVIWDMSQPLSSQLSSLTKQSINKQQQIGFIHNGHRSRVCDVSYSFQENIMASCQEGNVLQVWQVSGRFCDDKR